jgi:pyruvate/2-oxoglutarate dehydrogenase complex dihydrolipoamide acyltransferase (E2) component
MAQVLFPVLSEKDPEGDGVLATWLVADGDVVAEGQLIGEVMVEKVSADVTAPTSGQVQLLVAEEAVVRQGQPIATVE